MSIKFKSLLSSFCVTHYVVLNVIFMCFTNEMRKNVNLPAPDVVQDVNRC